MASQISMRVLIGAITILAGVVSIAIAFSTSLSVGGVVYLDSEACTSCHYEVPYYKGWKSSIHGEENVTCLDCHASAVIRDSICLSCHEDYDLTNKSKFLWDWVGVVIPVDSHEKNPHIGHVKCKTCHLEHEFRLGTPRAVTKDLCHLCHATYYGPRLSQQGA